jgi:acetyl/propionyl-CoA carboxylase alpha subunit
MSKAKLTPKTPEITLEKSSFLDYFDEGRLVEWFTENGKNILYGLAGLLGIIVLIYAFSSTQTNKAEQEYIQAANDFAYFSRTSDIQDSILATEALTRLNTILSKHPELHATYDGAIAQILLNREQTKEALIYAQNTLARVKSNNLTFYSDYAQNTLLISQKNFKQALENTLALQQKMKEEFENPTSEHTFGDELFALNLLRVAMLQQEQGDKPAELQTWQEWKQYAGLNSIKSTNQKVNPQAFRAVIQQLAVGSFSLPDYITYRENILKK